MVDMIEGSYKTVVAEWTVCVNLTHWQDTMVHENFVGSMATLYCIQSGTRGQCTLMRASLMWLERQSLKISHAASFRHDCSLPVLSTWEADEHCEVWSVPVYQPCVWNVMSESKHK